MCSNLRATFQNDNLLCAFLFLFLFSFLKNLQLKERKKKIRHKGWNPISSIPLLHIVFPLFTFSNQNLYIKTYHYDILSLLALPFSSKRYPKVIRISLFWFIKPLRIKFVNLTAKDKSILKVWTLTFFRKFQTLFTIHFV